MAKRLNKKESFNIQLLKVKQEERRIKEELAKYCKYRMSPHAAKLYKEMFGND